MQRSGKAVKFSKNVDNIEEQYIRSGGKDPYVLTLLTRAYSDGKKANDRSRRRRVTKAYETIMLPEQTLIRQYNDVELDNLRLQYELMDIQNKLKSQLPQKIEDDLSERLSLGNKLPNVLYCSPQNVKSPKPPTPISFPQTCAAGIDYSENAPVSLPPLPNNAPNMPFIPHYPFVPGLQPFLRNPFGNTYIVTGDEIYINGNDVTDQPGSKTTGLFTDAMNQRKIKTPNSKPGSASIPSGSKQIQNPRTKREGALEQARKLSAPMANSHPITTPTFGLDGDWDLEEDEVDYMDGDTFFEVNPGVPQGRYDFNSGIVVYFDFVTKLPKEARFCKLSIALITAGRMKPPISFTSLPTEQYAPGDHPEFRHFTTVCRFAYCLAVSGGRPTGASLKGGISLVAEIMTSTDKPVDETAPVLGWVRHGWAPISATRKTFDDDPYLTTVAGRFRTKLTTELPLKRDFTGLLELSDETEQETVGHRTELFYRIVNSQQSAVERLAPVDIKYMEYYDEF